MKILVTGGAGYIGSTVCSALIDAGHTPVIIDSLVTGKREFVHGRVFYEGDIADCELIETIIKEHPDVSCCMHFAARIVISESVAQPALYYEENVVKTISLFNTLKKCGINQIIFSSSAAVYQAPDNFEVSEKSAAVPISPYAKTKLIMEMAMEDFCAAGYFKGIALRYFNPIGADRKMRTGAFIAEPSHILGKLVAAAKGRESQFNIFGTDWNTRDGSTMRDYIHVWDLALAHVAAAEKFDQVFAEDAGNFSIINLGSGNGVTVKEFVDAFQRVYDGKLDVAAAPRRDGDTVGAFANCDKASRLLGWKAQMRIEDGIRDALIWEEQFNSQSSILRDSHV